MKKAMILFFTLTAVALTLCACSSGKDEEEIDSADFYQSWQAITECNDGWFLFTNYSYVLSPQGEMTDKVFNVDAVNLKYRGLQDFQVKYIDGATNKVTGTVAPRVSYLSMNTEYENLMKKVNSTLLARPLKADLTQSEIDYVKNNDIFTPQIIVDTYNTAMKNGDLTFGKYGNISESDLICENELDGYMWQVGYFIMYGNIGAINIELKRSDGVFLSDKPKDELSQTDKKILDFIDESEKSILKNQDMCAINNNGKSAIGDVSISRLSAILNDIEKENSYDPSE